jgi:hypothetical protein
VRKSSKLIKNEERILLLENAGLKTREVNLTRIAVGSVIVILLACYLFQRKTKEKGSSDRKSGRK